MKEHLHVSQIQNDQGDVRQVYIQGFHISLDVSGEW